MTPPDPDTTSYASIMAALFIACAIVGGFALLKQKVDKIDAPRIEACAAAGGTYVSRFDLCVQTIETNSKGTP
jgi:hypothetical protein